MCDQRPLTGDVCEPLLANRGILPARGVVPSAGTLPITEAAQREWIELNNQMRWVRELPDYRHQLANRELSEGIMFQPSQFDWTANSVAPRPAHTLMERYDMDADPQKLAYHCDSSQSDGLATHVHGGY